jgi:hypothetical protein
VRGTLHSPQRYLEGCLKTFGSGGRNSVRSGSGKHVSNEFDGLTHHIGEARSKTWMFKRSNGWVPRALSMARALAFTVLSPTPKAANSSAVFMCGDKGWVAKKIDSPEHVQDTARPRLRLTRSQWARALPAQRASHCARQGPIFGVQMPVAHVVGHADNLLVLQAASILEPSSSEREPSSKQP